MVFTGFGKGATRFFDDLAADNTRQWWLANKARYEAEVREPLELLLADLADEFGEAKVFRPNRDTRFSADKSPYKTAAAAMIGTPDGHASSLYIQVSADGLMLGGGCYHPARDQLARLREAIADDGTGAELEKVAAAVEAAGGVIDAADRLKTAPRGYSADHPRIEYLRMKGIIGVVTHPPAAWLHTPKVKDKVATAWHAFTPLNTWLQTHMGPSTIPADSRRR
jgi:uncharacterized protein (TIGR02453 family)